MNFSLYLPLIASILIVVVFFVFIKLCVKSLNFFHAVLACILGLLAVIPITSVQFFIEQKNLLQASTLPAVLLKALILNGIIEESFKMILLFFLPYKKMNVNSFFACGLLCGLSLACFENIIYFITGSSSLELRFFTSLIIHTTCCALSSLFVYSIRVKTLSVSPFVWAFLLHGVYNYFAGFKLNNVFFYISFVVVLISILECRIRFLRLRDRIDRTDAVIE